jgi:NAD(P)-dependent dehydrogenase (short-subunit alcohol dehydrogenase family)
VLFFSGGGTNNATTYYSAYTVSKIALIKMCELLDAELPGCRFMILGPGWVKTKIHEATLRAGGRAGANYQRTIEKLGGSECTPMENVLDCCDWLIELPRNLVSGRNFSVVFDRWGEPELEKKLAAEPHMYKLRRFGNDWLVR